MNQNKALFLDRDGVINRERGEYTYKVADFDILPDVFSTLQKAQEKGYKIIVITNQGGIAKGIYTHQDVKKLHHYLKEELAAKGVILTDILYSPRFQQIFGSKTRFAFI